MEEMDIWKGSQADVDRKITVNKKNSKRTKIMTVTKKGLNY